ncbi:NUDIX hydrolase [Streptosporangium sp. NPDC050855]|uniref:NUDIX hydrolase n=1 Tax=Streptosporangium sp. NPDC050855 TaxID=3366194 RepID=UPI0037A08F9D
MHLNHAPVSATPAARCDNRSVGVLICNDAGEYLMVERAVFPVGIAPVAGHIDEHGGPAEAARAEVFEEVGLTVTELTSVLSAWWSNRCGRELGPDGGGHDWHIFRAQVTGELAPSPHETRGARWYTVEQLQELTDRTIDYAAGHLAEEEFAAAPGLEATWVHWLAELGVVDIDLTGLLQVASLSTHGCVIAPSESPIGCEPDPWQILPGGRFD